MSNGTIFICKIVVAIFAVSVLSFMAGTMSGSVGLLQQITDEERRFTEEPAVEESFEFIRQHIEDYGPIDLNPPHTFDDLLDAIEWVESRGDPWAVGANGEVGAYQLSKIYVDDVNRFSWPGRFTYKERYVKHISRNMVRKYLKHYGGTFEEMARKHNGGPNGWKKESTKPYWEKIQARMQNARGSK